MVEKIMTNKSAFILGIFILISSLVISSAILFRPEAGKYVLTNEGQNNLIVTDTTSGRIWFFSSSDGKWRESLKRPWIDAE